MTIAMKATPAELEGICQSLRADIIKMLTESASGHPGGSLSLVEILVALFWGPLKYDPKNPDWRERDRVILSKGHGCPALYAVMAELGYFPKEELMKLRKTGAMLQGHPVRSFTPGIEANTGALGQGLSVAQGMALAARLDGNGSHTWCITGDGEIQEGSVWEAAMSAGNLKIDNLTCIVDYNKAQIDGYTKDVMDLEPLADKWRAFKWNVIEFQDAHNIDALVGTYEEALATKGKPTVIIAHTVKGKGVSFMENEVGWHGVAPSTEQRDQALAEIEK